MTRETANHQLPNTLRTLSALLFAFFLACTTQAQAAQSVTLSWNTNAEPDIVGYTVRYGTSSGNYTLSSDAGNATTKTISTLTAGQNYFFAVTATSAAGLESAPSAEVTFTASPNQLPSVTLTSPASGAQFTAPASIVLTASAADSDGSIGRVEFYNGTTKIGESTSSPYGFTWSGVPAGAYSLKAVAFDNLGASTQSSAIGVTVNTPPPAVITGLSATAISASQINLSWAASSGATSYTVKRSATSGGTYTNVATGVTGVTYANTGLTASTAYYYVVSAVNAGGASANSTQATATTLAQAPVPPVPTGLSATAGNAQAILRWTASSGASSYNVKRSTTSGGPYTTVGSGVTGISYTNTGLTNGTPYYYVASAVNASGESSNSAQVAVTPTAGLPSPWLNRDIGAVGAAGSTTYSNGTFTINASGADIAARTDEFQYVYQTASGDCTIVARVATVGNTDAKAKAGTMIRETTGATSRYAAVLVTPGSGIQFQRRTNTGGTTATTVAAITAPQWIKLTRTANVLKAFYSPDGTTWTQFGNNRTVTMGTTVTIGLAGCSRVDGTLGTSTVGSVTATP